MKSYHEEKKIKLNPCKYCGETDLTLIYNRFNNTDHCCIQCACGAYVQRYCPNPLIVEQLEPTVIGVWNNGNISEPYKRT